MEILETEQTNSKCYCTYQCKGSGGGEGEAWHGVGI